MNKFPFYNCSPCAKTHEILHELLDSMDAGLSVRFTIDKAKNGKHMQAVEYMLQLLAGKGADYKRQVLHDWYLLMDLEQFSKKYPLREKNNVDRLLKKQEKWAKETGISFTPTIFINGNELPGQYTADDLIFVLRGFEWKEGII